MSVLIPSLLYSAMFFFALGFAGVFYGLWRGHQFNSYLKKNYYARWCELTSGLWFGPGGVNTSRAWKYIKSDLDESDERILSEKNRAKQILRYILFNMLAGLVQILTLVVVAVIYRAKNH